MPLCSFYRTPRGCMYGDQCRFEHADSCRFFQSVAGCRFGNNCSFSHTLSSLDAYSTRRDQSYPIRSSENESYRNYPTRSSQNDYHQNYPIRSSEHDSYRNNQLRRFEYSSYRNSNSSNQEADSVQNRPKTNSEPRSFMSSYVSAGNLQSAISVESLTEEKMALCFKTDSEILKMKYPECDWLDNERCAVIVFECSDPDWPFPMNATRVKMTFPQFYPKQVLEVSCIHNQAVPRQVTNHINSQLTDYLNARQTTIDQSGFSVLMVRPFLKWFDRSLKDFYFRGLKQAKLNSTVEVANINQHVDLELDSDNTFDATLKQTFVAYRKNEDGLSIEDAREKLAEQLKHHNLNDEVDEFDDEYEYSSSSESDNEDDSEQAGSASSSRKQNKGGTVTIAERCGIEISLLNFAFQTENICTISCRSIGCSFTCSRCGTLFDMKMHPNSAISQECVKCRTKMMVNFRPSLMHQSCNVLGYFDTENCSPHFNINAAETLWAFMCSNCNMTTNSPAVNAEEVKLVFCHNCHHKYEVKYAGVKFKDLMVRHPHMPKMTEAKPATGKKKERDMLSLIPGEPLPKKGTCKHYRKSYRWLRFPCCGRVYPCDVCHNDVELHEIEFANRMICGFCSKEQGYQKSKSCTGCSKELAGTTGSHWEGGIGCRNQKKMNKSDAQKYRNRNKTIAKKNVASNNSKK